MVSVTSASRYVTSASCMVYIRGLILRNSTDLARAVTIDYELDRDGIHVLAIFEFDQVS